MDPSGSCAKARRLQLRGQLRNWSFLLTAFPLHPGRTRNAPMTDLWLSLIRDYGKSDPTAREIAGLFSRAV